jgi:hypothetical protein
LIALRFASQLLIIACAWEGQKSNVPVILGVLEDTQYYPDQQDYRSVRAVFQKQADEWHPFDSFCPDQNCARSFAPDFKSEVTWTVAFDGKNLGNVTTRPGDFPNNASDGQQQIASTGSVPTVGKKSREFGGFTEQAVYRPLAAVSQPNFKDPDMWKPARATELVALARRQFRKRFPKLCKLDKEGTNLLSRPYRDEDVKMGKAYSSRTGWSVIELRLDAVDCQDTEAGFGIDNQWFVIDPHKSASFLGSGMWLVDAGDYDNCGKSELLFSIDQYNRGGYILFYEDFRRRAVFEYSFH